MSEKIQPTRGWFLAKRNLAPVQTSSGIIIPESARKRASDVQTGSNHSVEVVAMHPDDQFVHEYNEETDQYGPTTELRLGFQPGDTVYVKAMEDNLIPVVTDTYGRVEVREGVQVPDYYLFKVDAVAGVIRKENV